MTRESRRVNHDHDTSEKYAPTQPNTTRTTVHHAPHAQAVFVVRRMPATDLPAREKQKPANDNEHRPRACACAALHPARILVGLQIRHDILYARPTRTIKIHIFEHRECNEWNARNTSQHDKNHRGLRHMPAIDLVLRGRHRPTTTNTAHAPAPCPVPILRAHAGSLFENKKLGYNNRNIASATNGKLLWTMYDTCALDGRDS